MIKPTKQQAIKDIHDRLNQLQPYPELEYLSMLYQKLLQAISHPDMYYSDNDQAYLAVEALERLIQHEVFGIIDDSKHMYKHLTQIEENKYD